MLEGGQNQWTPHKRYQYNQWGWRVTKGANEKPFLRKGGSIWTVMPFVTMQIDQRETSDRIWSELFIGIYNLARMTYAFQVTA